MISDGCTGVPDEKFRHCCVEHDAYYGDESMTRLEADNRLFKCILGKAHNPISWVYYLGWASVYWTGVRLLGGSRYGVEE